ncbi:beta-ketoacyl-[acyl-carrier-protein] synthase family protein [Imhoffiella purpurea]|uniref:beta-ketoacyl-[acyl-carrier-protein] synthase family protein n=1 Tax=Imhoffiella purpurea TaxID=1249627 RepID=UPI0005C1D7F9|nr:beta-ketoacyl-[acyl-carrier-protein] synthase family protein [Imhoffiella purpurea]
MEPLSVTAFTLVNALGLGCTATLEALRDGRSGLTHCDLPEIALDTWIGRVPDLESAPLPAGLEIFDCRNNRLANLTLQQDGFDREVERVRARYGPERIGLFLGTSTSGLEHTEAAYRRRARSGTRDLGDDLRFDHTHSNFSLGAFCRSRLGIGGPTQVVSTACSSSAKVFATASRHLASGLCDAAIVGGADTLCATTLHGFASLELLAPEPCRPWGRDRRGIALGEGAGFVLLERIAPDPDRPALLGYGESSDAHHISSPHPEGLGPALAMRAALERAGLAPGSIDYLNLHATGTPANDRAEDLGIAHCFDRPPRASGTKGWTGHTLGAAGVTEVVICLLTLEHGFLPENLNRGERDPDLKLDVLEAGIDLEPRIVMTNSFGFGGTNASLVLGYPG